MIDEEILTLERRIATGDLLAWPLLDAALVRAGRTPRRVWYVWFCTGEYSDRSEGILEPVHSSLEGARAHLAQEAQRVSIKVSEDGKEASGKTQEPEGNSKYSSWCETSLTIQWSEMTT